MTAPSNYTPEQVRSLLSFGFTQPDSTAPQRLVVNLAGQEKTGKTHLALTGRPPIFIFNIDVGTEGVVEKFQRIGKEVWSYPVRMQRIASGANEGQLQQLWRDQWEDLKSKLSWVYQYCNPGTVVLDTWTEAYELARLAHFGKIGAMPNQYATVYQDLRAAVRWSYDHPTATTVFVSKMTPKFNAPNELEVRGFGDMDFLVQVNLRNQRIDADPGQPGPGQFLSYIKDCRQNPFCNGYVLSGDQFSLEYLEGFVHQWSP